MDLLHSLLLTLGLVLTLNYSVLSGRIINRQATFTNLICIYYIYLTYFAYHGQQRKAWAAPTYKVHWRRQRELWTMPISTPERSEWSRQLSIFYLNYCCSTSNLCSATVCLAKYRNAHCFDPTCGQFRQNSSGFKIFPFIVFLAEISRYTAVMLYEWSVRVCASGVWPECVASQSSLQMCYVFTSNRAETHGPPWELQTTWRTPWDWSKPMYTMQTNAPST